MKRTLECPREKPARTQGYSSITVRTQCVRRDCRAHEGKYCRQVCRFDGMEFVDVSSRTSVAIFLLSIVKHSFF